MEFVLIPSGSFMMGADKDLENAKGDALPQRQVSVSRPFYLGKFEVTQQEWVAVMGENPANFQGMDNPVETVSWGDVQIFIQRLNQMEKHSRYRLPTEAEWEYAARAGSKGAYYFGDDESQLGWHAWYEGNSGNSTHPVGEKRPNAWGLYDILGNVIEWVSDWYGAGYYGSGPPTDPQGPTSGAVRVIRGCGWSFSASLCQSANRDAESAVHRDNSIGFRLALTIK
jgi:formylglycine-generating enzyme required for sulfatase activity